jgi:hypothetical protein
MPHIIAALFEDQARAQRALQGLLEAGVARDRIAIVGEGEAREVSSISGFRELSARDDQTAQLHDLPLPDEDLQVFEHGLRRGHVLMAARVDRENIEEAMRVIDLFDPIDVDRQSEAWSREAGAPHAGAAGADVGAPLGAGVTAGMGTGTTNTAAMPGTGTMTDHTHDVGAADLRTGEADLGLGSTTATGHRRDEERAGRPGVMELDQGAQDPSADASLATKMAPGTGGVASRHGNAKPDLYRRESVRIGRVRAYSRD